MEEFPDISLIAANAIVDLLPINKNYVDIEAIAENILPYIEKIVNALQQQNWYLNGDFENGDSNIADTILSLKIKDDIIQAIAGKDVSSHTEDEIFETLVRVFEEVQPDIVI